MATAMRGKAKLSDGKEELCYEMFCDGCAVCAMYGKGLDKRSLAKAWIGQADLGNAKAWMRDDSLRHRYEQMRNGVEQIRAEEQRQRNASRGGEARSKGKAKYF